MDPTRSITAAIATAKKIVQDVTPLGSYEAAPIVDTKITGRPTLKFNSDAGTPRLASVAVSGLDPEVASFLGGSTLADSLLKSIFRVTVVQAKDALAVGQLPDVCGRYRLLENELWFIPHFPFAAGVKYRASFDPHVFSDAASSERLTLNFSLPDTQDAVPTEVESVYPTSDSLPENLLRFYVRFSRPMQRGYVEEQIALLGPDGCPAPDVLYRAPVKLWDRSMRHLTILLDPGRLKRGVGPNVELGSPLKVGQEYTLAIGSGLIDLSGRPLRKNLFKRFRVTEAVREPIAVEQWKIAPLLAGSRQPLVVTFPRPLDWAMLWQAITIESTDGRAIDGRISIDQDEKRWSFTPSLPWATNSYRVQVASGLEDICGNSVIAAFDRPLRSGGNLAREANIRSITVGLDEE